MLKTIIRKLERKKDNDMDIDVAQLECNNNKCYISAFRYIQICRYRLLLLLLLFFFDT